MVQIGLVSTSSIEASMFTRLPFASSFQLPTLPAVGQPTAFTCEVLNGSARAVVSPVSPAASVSEHIITIICSACLMPNFFGMPFMDVNGLLVTP